MNSPCLTFDIFFSLLSIYAKENICNATDLITDDLFSYAA